MNSLILLHTRYMCVHMYVIVVCPFRFLTCVSLLVFSLYCVVSLLCYYLSLPFFSSCFQTTQVPPQQLEWIQHDARGLLLLTTLKPLTVRNVVVSFLGGDGTMTYEEAKDRRERLMRERKAAELSACMTHASQRFYVPTVSFCEH